MKNLSLLFTVMLSLFLLSACETVRVGGGTSSHENHGSSPAVKKGGPPAHAPAHGYRKKFDYRYYPSKKVYYCVERKLYFWIEGDGWKLGVELPSNISLSGSDSVAVDISDDTPYLHYEANYRDSHPGKGKAKGKNKEKGKGRYK